MEASPWRRSSGSSDLRARRFEACHGLSTANSEGDPVAALGGAVATSETLKQLHQTMDAVSICKPVTKFSATVASSDTLSEVMESTFSEDSSTQIKAMKKKPSIRWIEAILDIALLAGFISAMGFLVRLAF
jgi:hypothetical protein